jgi:gas vesicle protein
MQNRGRQVSAPNSIGQKSNPALLYPENELVRLIFRELKLAKQLRIEAEKYQQETETRARSQAHMLLLRARLATRKEIIAEFKHKASEEIEKEIEQLKRRANEEMQKEIKAEFKRKADEEIQKKITELISTADEEMQKKLTELISTADEEIQKKLTELVNTANQGMTELIGTANQEIQKEIEQFKGKVNKETHEIQQVLTDIRKMRIAADNELKIQQKLTDANRIIALTSSSQ